MPGISSKYVAARLVDRMPTPGLLAKVGPMKDNVSQSLVDRMPSPEIAAKVGGPIKGKTATHRVVRLRARG